MYSNNILVKRLYLRVVLRDGAEGPGRSLRDRKADRREAYLKYYIYMDIQIHSKSFSPGPSKKQP